MNCTKLLINFWAQSNMPYVCYFHNCAFDELKKKQQQQQNNSDKWK